MTFYVLILVMSRSNRKLSKRQKMSILLDGSGNRVVSPLASRRETLAEYDPALFVSVSKKYWSKWMEDVLAERHRLLDAASQYASPAGVKILLELEQLHVKMEKVRLLLLRPTLLLRFSGERFTHPNFYSEGIWQFDGGGGGKHIAFVYYKPSTRHF